MSPKVDLTLDCTMNDAIIENIEMKLFASFESPLHLLSKDRNTEPALTQTFPEVPCKEDNKSETLCKQKGEEVPATIHLEEEDSPAVNDMDLHEAIEIEMDILQPHREEIMEQIIGVTSRDSSVLSPDPEKPSMTLTPRQGKVKKPRWQSMEMKTPGLVVKDVICLPYETYLKRDHLYYVPSNRDREMLASMGLVARITIDSSWLSEEMEGRLASLFKHRFSRCRGEKFKFSYLQCFQGSGVLFEPSMPGNCWTAQEVLRICKNGCLYILSHYILVDTVRNMSSDPLEDC